MGDFMIFFKKISKFFIFFMLLFLLIHGGLYVYCISTPKLQISRNQSYYLYDNNNELIFNNYSWLDLDQISKYLIDATLSTICKKFIFKL